MADRRRSTRPRVFAGGGAGFERNRVVTADGTEPLTTIPLHGW